MQEIEISKGIKRIQFDSFDSWLNARHGIGGSDASAVLGLNPYKTNIELYLEKTGQRMAPDISDKDYVKYGHDAEPLLRSLFALDHPEYKVEYLEIKTTNILQSMQREKWKDQIPDNYYIQVLHYLLVSEYEFVELRAQLKSVWQGQIRLETKDYHIERLEAEEDIEILKQAEEEFWQKVLKRQQPHLILPEI